MWQHVPSEAENSTEDEMNEWDAAEFIFFLFKGDQQAWATAAFWAARAVGASVALAVSAAVVAGLKRLTPTKTNGHGSEVE
jgi:hypothetical protein